MNEQLNLFPDDTGKTKVTPPVLVNVRFGKIDPRFVTESDIGRICAPHGEGAQDAFDRDVGFMDDRDDYDDYDDPYDDRF